MKEQTALENTDLLSRISKYESGLLLENQEPDENSTLPMKPGTFAEKLSKAYTDKIHEIVERTGVKTVQLWDESLRRQVRDNSTQSLSI